jgi:ribonuclease E
MLEMSRQRIKQTLEQGSVLDCPHCSGRGKVKGVENMAISFLRKVHAAAAKGNASEVRGALPLEVAYYLLNRKKRELAQIENDYDIEVTIKGKPSFLMNQLELEVIKREKVAETQYPEEKVVKEKVVKKLAPLEKASVAEPETAVPAEETVAAGHEELPAKKKRSRSKKKKVEPEGTEALPVTADEPEEVQPSAAAELLSEEPTGAEEHTEAGKKKRKRRRRKKGKAVDAAGHAEVSDSPAEEPIGETVLPVEESAAHETDAAGAKKKKRRRRKRGGAKASPEGVAEEMTQGQPEVAAVETVAAEVAPATPKKRTRSRKTAVAKTTDEPAAQVSAPPDPPVPVDDQPKKRRPVAKKKAASEEPVAAAIVTPAAAVDLAGQSKAKRMPRKKKIKEQEGE